MEAIETPMADYPYRVPVTREQLSLHLAAEVDNLNYPNFKDKVVEARGRKYGEALYAVWVAMLSTEEHPRNFDR